MELANLLGTVKTEVSVGFDLTSSAYLAAAILVAAVLSILFAYILFKVI